MSPTRDRKLVILGASLFAEEVADMVSDIDEFEVIGFVEGQSVGRCDAPVLGLPVFWIDEVSALSDRCYGVCAVGSTKRRGFIQQATDQGLEFTSVRHPSAHVAASTTLAEGALVSPRAVVGARTEIGRHAILNRGCLIGHHVAIGDYVTVSPGANIAGKVTIGSGSYIGMGAIVLDGVSIGRGAVVGAGAVVTKDVPDAVQVVGVPARIVKHLKEG